MSQEIEKTVSLIWQSADSDPSLQLYAIFDAARDTRIHSRLAESGVEAASLFRGEQALELADVAPYLVPLHRDDSFIEWLFTYGWGNAWGIVIESQEGLRELRRHFQALVMVYDSQGKPLYFRYYDPRVFRIYLPTCNESELKTVFGPVNSFYVEGEDRDYLIHYVLADGKLVERKTHL
ncbi:MAG TPA: DUF4123 domain-containing protein [Syntrophobacteraceae bacterium]|nr:DUF4123 domain-containing protein [Syntrophobacteraceae bacterium]